jgi:hypothetical protein
MRFEIIWNDLKCILSSFSKVQNFASFLTQPVVSARIVLHSYQKARKKNLKIWAILSD